MRTRTAPIEKATKMLTSGNKESHVAHYAVQGRGWHVYCECGQHWHQRGTVADLLTTHSLHVRAIWAALDAMMGR